MLFCCCKSMFLRAFYLLKLKSSEKLPDGPHSPKCGASSQGKKQHGNFCLFSWKSFCNLASQDGKFVVRAGSTITLGCRLPWMLHSANKSEQTNKQTNKQINMPVRFLVFVFVSWFYSSTLEEKINLCLFAIWNTHDIFLNPDWLAFARLDKA